MSKPALKYCYHIFKVTRLSPNARHALKELCYKHRQGERLRIALSDLGSCLGCNKRSVCRAVDELKAKGVLIVISEPNRPRRLAQSYRFPAKWDVSSSDI
jgi:hypothetical protein